MNIRSAIFATVMLVILWCLYGDRSLAIAQFIGGERITDITKAGAWGDSFGGFNAFISTAGFGVVLATLLQQGKALQKQAADQHKQQFENSFFQLLALLRDLREQIVFTHSEEYKSRHFTITPFSTGRVKAEEDVAKNPVAAANREIHFWLAMAGKSKRAKGIDYINIYMHRVHSSSEATLAPFFRIIYAMLRRIKSDRVLGTTDKAFYANLVRSQLTSSDILLLAINALAPISADLSDLVIEFRMLKYLPESSMRTNLERIYPPSAFEGRNPRNRSIELVLS